MSDLTALKQSAWKANLQLWKQGLVIHSFGNVSVLDREAGLFAIKPSGVLYDQLQPEDMVVLNLEGQIVEGSLRPSSDTATHLALYRELPETTSIVHTHSTHAVAWAQAHRAIPLLGTTHADQYPGPIPVTPELSDTAIQGHYEHETGLLILETLKQLPTPHPEMILVAGHGPFTWGRTPESAVLNSVMLEEIARMALLTLQLDPQVSSLKTSLVRKHFERKHGPKATYGQH